MPRIWTRLEVEAAVADYFSMFAKELRGEPYSKAAHRRALRALLDDRSDGSVERKHQNISAALIDAGYPYIFGYKPLLNYQRLVAEVVDAWLARDGELTAAVQTSADAPAQPELVSDPLARLEQAPEPARQAYPKAAHEPQGRARTRVNYLEREARNASLGLAGEHFVLDFERARLRRLGKDRLAERVEHLAVLEGDGLGFDIRSFEPNGTDRLIEVKTTAYGKETPFFVSKNEVEVSSRRADRYHLYRVFRFRRDPRLFTLHGALEQRCLLEPVQYRARVS